MIKDSDMVPKALALKYIGIQELCKKILKFLGYCGIKNPSEGVILSSDFFKTIDNLMKVYKNNRAIFEHIFECLSKFQFTT